MRVKNYPPLGVVSHRNRQILGHCMMEECRPALAVWATCDRCVFVAPSELTPEVVKCCTACHGRLARRLAGRPEPPAEPAWTEAELERLRAALRRAGADWQAAAAAVGSRRPAQCRRLYARRQPELGLQTALADYRQVRFIQKFWLSITYFNSHISPTRNSTGVSEGPHETGPLGASQEWD